MEITRVKYYFILIDDVVGAFGRVADFFRERNIDLAGLWCFGVGRGKAQVFVVPKERESFKTAMAESEWIIKEGHCFQLRAKDEVGVLVDVLKKIAAAGIDLHGIDAMNIDASVGCYIWPSESDVEQVGQILGA